jgi:hypothetical protein
MSEHERSFIVLRYTSFVGAVLAGGRGMVETFAGDTSANESLCESREATSLKSLSFIPL